MEKITMDELREKGMKITNGKITYNGKKCVLDFYADWCQPCKPQLVVLTELSKEYNDVDFYKVNVEDEYELAELLHIRNLPTVYVIGKDVKSVSGFTQRTKIEDLLNNTINV